MDRNIALDYVRKRRRKKRAAIISGISAIGITIFLIIAFCLIYVDRFTIKTDAQELSLTLDKETFTTQLAAPPFLEAKDTQYTDIPADIDEGFGSKNTKYYFAYSFYLGAVSNNKYLDYGMKMVLNKCSNSIEEAMRVMIIRNGIKTIYAQADEDGTPEVIKYGATHESEPEVIGTTVPFDDQKYIIYKPYSIVSGEYDKYTVVMWIDGWESDNSMKSGEFQAELKFSIEKSYN